MTNVKRRANAKRIHSEKLKFPFQSLRYIAFIISRRDPLYHIMRTVSRPAMSRSYPA
jgi:hypothetical protein